MAFEILKSGVHPPAAMEEPLTDTTAEGPVGIGERNCDRPAQKPAGERRRLARYECLDCGQVGPAAELRSHAERGECKDFRVTTTVLSADGKLLDECVEVCQI